MKLNQKVIASLICAMSLLTSFPTFASTTTNENKPQSQSFNIDEIDINKLSKDNNVDPDQLRASIEKSLKSTIFSPFSEIKSQKNKKESSSEKVKDSNLNVNSSSWIVRVDQDSTAYTSRTGARTASGAVPKIGMAAVHQYSSGTPYIPFGTRIYYENAVTIQGNQYASFDVQDTGDLDFNLSDYWTDLYFGISTASSEKAVVNYGQPTVTYGYYS